MASTPQLRKFDPTEHVGHVYDAFVDFLGSFAYEYEVLAKQPPTGTTDTAAWTQQDKRKYLLGRFASRNLQLDLRQKQQRLNGPQSPTMTPSRSSKTVTSRRKIQHWPTTSFIGFVKGTWNHTIRLSIAFGKKHPIVVSSVAMHVQLETL